MPTFDRRYKRSLLSVAVARDLSQAIIDLRDQDFDPQNCTATNDLTAESHNVTVTARLAYRTSSEGWNPKNFSYKARSYPTGGILITATTLDFQDKKTTFTRRLRPGWTHQQAYRAINNIWWKSWDFYCSQKPVRKLYLWIEQLGLDRDKAFLDKVSEIEDHPVEYEKMTPEDVSFWNQFVSHYLHNQTPLQ